MVIPPYQLVSLPDFWTINSILVGGFKEFLFFTLLGEMIQFHEHIFQMGWNHRHQLVFLGCFPRRWKNAGISVEKAINFFELMGTEPREIMEAVSRKRKQQQQQQQQPFLVLLTNSCDYIYYSYSWRIIHFSVCRV